MSNSKLVHNKTDLGEDILFHLRRVFNAYKGAKDVEGYERLKGLCDSDTISYEQLKRIKNFFDGFDGSVKDTTYMLNGGTKMKNWVEMTLDNMRSNVNSKKKNMSAVGMNNQYQKQDPTSIGKVGDKEHDTDNNKILRQEGIYRIKVLDDIISEINKNKKSCLMDNQYHQS